jgi:hypothetical protein
MVRAMIVVVLIGWLWEGAQAAISLPTNTWVVRKTPAFPASVGAAAKHVRMAYDRDRQVIYFWGGDYCVASAAYPGGERCASHEEFWEYNVATNAWALLLNQTQANTAGYPRGVCVAAFTYDPVRKVVWMTGGEQRYDQYAAGLVSCGLWAFDPVLRVWSKEGPAPDCTTRETTKVDSTEVMFMQYNYLTNKLMVPSYNGGSGSFMSDFSLSNVTVRDGVTQNNWSTRPGPTDAPNFEQAMFAIDTKRNRAIFYVAYHGELWAQDLSTGASTLLKKQSLPMKDQFGMVYDSKNDVIVMFGGFSAFQGEPGATALNALWVLNLTTNIWSQPTLSGAISPRHGDNLVYDSFNEVIVVFGGTGGWQNGIDQYGYDGSEIFLLRLDLGGGMPPDTVAPAAPTNLRVQ